MTKNFIIPCEYKINHLRFYDVTSLEFEVERFDSSDFSQKESVRYTTSEAEITHCFHVFFSQKAAALHDDHKKAEETVDRQRAITHHGRSVNSHAGGL